MINVTKTFLPPINEYKNFLEDIWNTCWLTNRGPLVRQLEEKLKEYLNINNIIITTNGTIPLQIALKLLGNSGEIITTPFSYVATASAIIWEGCTPVFVDIHPEYLTIDEAKIEEAITPRTTAILATHVFGNACNIEAINKIAEKYRLKVIYDAAHCFNVKYNNQSIFNYGDISTCSFHATKLFHTGEGGALFCKDRALWEKLFYSHNFGHSSPYTFHGLGINGKISELQAAMGLAVFPYMNEIIAERKKVVDFYDAHLDSARFQKLRIRAGTDWNFSYYPIILKTEAFLMEKQAALAKENILPRRYFYPSLNTVAYMNGDSMPVSESIAPRILCLPLYVGLTIDELMCICKIMNS